MRSPITKATILKRFAYSVAVWVGVGLSIASFRGFPHAADLLLLLFGGVPAARGGFVEMRQWLLERRRGWRLIRIMRHGGGASWFYEELQDGRWVDISSDTGDAARRAEIASRMESEFQRLTRMWWR